MPPLKKHAKATECYQYVEKELVNAYQKKDWAKVEEASIEMIKILSALNELSPDVSATPISGVGVEISTNENDHSIQILRVVAGSPAEAGGIKAGETLFKVNGKSVKNLSIEEVISLIRGAPGSPVNLELSTNGRKEVKHLIRASLPRSARKISMAREFWTLHHAYFMQNKTIEASNLYPAAKQAVLDQYGRGSEQMLDLLEKQAILLRDSKPEEARAIAEEIISFLTQKDNIEEDIRIWRAHNLAALALIKLGRVADSADHINQSLRYYKNEKNFKNRKSQAQEQSLLLYVYQNSCKVKNLTPLISCDNYSKDLYEIATKELTKSDRVYWFALSNYADTLSKSEPVEIWLPIAKESIKLLSMHEDSRMQAIFLSALASKIQALNIQDWQLFNESIDLQSKAIKAIEKANGALSLQAQEYRINLALIYAVKGLHEKAKQTYQEVQTRTISSPETGEKADERKISILSRIAEYFAGQGQTTEAAQAINAAISICKKYNNDKGARWILLRLRATQEMLATRNYTKSLDLLLQAERTLDAFKVSSLSLGHESAAEHTQFVNKQRLRIGLLYDQASIQALLSDYKNAIITLKRAALITKTLGPLQDSHLNFIETRLVDIQLAANQLSTAAETAQKMLDRRKDASAYLTAGVTRAFNKEPEVAFDQFINYTNMVLSDATEMLWRTPRKFHSELSGSAFASKGHLFIDYGPNPMYSRAALYARTNLHGLSQELERKQYLLASMSKKSAAIAKEIRSLDKETESPSLSVLERVKILQTIDEKEKSLLAAIPSLRQTPVSIEAIASSLPNDGLLIEFQKVENTPNILSFRRSDEPKKYEYIALTLNHNGEIRRFSLGDAEVVDNAINKAISASSQGYSDSSLLWVEVANKIIRPLDILLSSYGTLFLSPDAEINRVPFGALSLLGVDQLFNKQIRILTTGREIGGFKDAYPNSGSSVVFANPAYSLVDSRRKNNSQNIRTSRGENPQSTNHTTWTPLPQALEEGRKVAALIKAKFFEGEKANESTVKELSSPKILHIASHSFFKEIRKGSDSEGNMSYPGSIGSGITKRGFLEGMNDKTRAIGGIVLSGANDSPSNELSNGYLTDEEIVRLNLQGTELVVLSGCDSGLGVANIGDGFYGLRRALAVAGARSSILSLWKVDDAATANFMIRFYTHLKNGASRSEALLKTQHEFHSGLAGKGNWRHPYYWAAWQLVGDWRQIVGLRK